MSTDRQQALQRQYRASLPQKAEKLRTAWRGLSGAQPDVALDRIRILTHRLAGSAGMYGFGDLSRQARSLLSCLNALAVPFNGSDRDRANGELERLLRILARDSAVPAALHVSASGPVSSRTETVVGGAKTS